jgi:SAM-dependent methyltransferase
VGVFRPFRQRSEVGCTLRAEGVVDRPVWPRQATGPPGRTCPSQSACLVAMLTLTCFTQTAVVIQMSLARLNMDDDKQRVKDFWNKASCGEELYLAELSQAGFDAQRERRYELEPYIREFARFEETRGQAVLEIGVGLGADHEGFARAGANLHGIDLTERAIARTRQRLDLFGLRSVLQVADAEQLPFPDESFDVVYSWGVLHHSPNTEKAISEVHRVLRPGGRASIMIYNYWSLVGVMLWARYALLRGRPFTGLGQVYGRFLESPGTKAYTAKEARGLFSGWSSCDIRTVLTHGDLLIGGAGQRHRGRLLSIARRVWPRWLLRRALPSAGLFMLIDARR